VSSDGKLSLGALVMREKGYRLLGSKKQMLSILELGDINTPCFIENYVPYLVCA
jgi:hypothetical protein